MSKIDNQFKPDFKNSVICQLKSWMVSEKNKNVVNVLKKALKRIQENKLGENVTVAKKEERLGYKI